MGQSPRGHPKEEGRRAATALRVTFKGEVALKERFSKKEVEDRGRRFVKGGPTGSKAAGSPQRVGVEKKLWFGYSQSHW